MTRVVPSFRRTGWPDVLQRSVSCGTIPTEGEFLELIDIDGKRAEVFFLDDLVQFFPEHPDMRRTFDADSNLSSLHLYQDNPNVIP